MSANEQQDSLELAPEDDEPSYAYRLFWHEMIPELFPRSWVDGEVPYTPPKLDIELDDEPKPRRRTNRPGWSRLCQEVWDRDGDVCQVCQDKIPWEHYECGHIVDRCAGGKDEMDNLLVMCNLCNRYKPVHETREEFEQWRRETHGCKGILVKQYAEAFGVKKLQD